MVPGAQETADVARRAAEALESGREGVGALVIFMDGEDCNRSWAGFHPAALHLQTSMVQHRIAHMVAAAEVSLEAEVAEGESAH